MFHYEASSSLKSHPCGKSNARHRGGLPAPQPNIQIIAKSPCKSQGRKREIKPRRNNITVRTKSRQICHGKAGALEMPPGGAYPPAEGSPKGRLRGGRESPVHQRQVGGLEPTVAREHVCGPDVISTATGNGAREGARVEIMSVGCPQTAGRASRSGQVPDYLSRNSPLRVRATAIHLTAHIPMPKAGVRTVTRTVATHCKANQHCAEGLGTDPAKVIFYKKFAFLSD